MSALWDYLNQQHGLTLVESEINDILELARQEIELPDEEEIVDLAHDYINAHGCYGNLYDAYKEGFLQSMTKVRNPYPKTINWYSRTFDSYRDPKTGANVYIEPRKEEG